jgi:uncharacterized protein (DUF4415 family)
MARKVHIVLEDDLDGTPAAETVVFGIDGSSYEIDLSEANAQRFREVLAPYIGVSRRAGRGSAERAAAQTGTRVRKASGAAAAGVDPAAVRAWAHSRGIKVNDRGRISADVIKAFKAAGN